MGHKRVRTHVNPLAVEVEHCFEGFGNTNPIFIDVGAFKGEFMQQLSQKFPDHNYLLFEIRQIIAQDLEKKFKDQKNFKIFDGDAGRNFESIVKPCLESGAKIEKIFVNFPDPWFKEKHKKRRFVKAPFLENLATWLPEETKIIFQTDQVSLFEETLEVVKASKFRNIKFFSDSVYGIPTDWEKAKLEKGEKIYRMEFQQKFLDKKLKI